MEKIRKIDHLIFDTLLGFLAKVFGLVMVISVVIQIACRYLPMAPLRWTEEMARLTFAWFSFIAAVMTYAQNKHLSMDFFYRTMNEKVKRVLDIVAHVVVLVFAVVVTYYGIKLLGIVKIQRSPMLRISMAYFYASVPFSGALLGVKAVFNLIHYLTGGEHLEPID